MAMLLGKASADLLLHPVRLRIIKAFLGSHRGQFARDGTGSRRGDIVEFGGELTGGQRPVAEGHSSAFMAYVAGLLADFDRYLAAGTPDLSRDGAGYTVAGGALDRQLRQQRSARPASTARLPV
jgi:hypothetical protein